MEQQLEEEVNRSYRRATEFDVKESKNFVLTCVEDVITSHNKARFANLFVGVENDVINYFSTLDIAPETWLLFNLFAKSDQRTAYHAASVAALLYPMVTNPLGKKVLGFSDENKKNAIIAALFHDFGKCLLSIDTLHKNEELTEHDWIEIYKHPGVGAKILLEHNKNLKEWYGDDKSKLIPKEVIAAIRQHHLFLTYEHLAGRYISYPKAKHPPVKMARLLKLMDNFQTAVMRNHTKPDDGIKTKVTREILTDILSRAKGEREMSYDKTSYFKGKEYDIDLVKYLLHLARKDRSKVPGEFTTGIKPRPENLKGAFVTAANHI